MIKQLFILDASQINPDLKASLLSLDTADPIHLCIMLSLEWLVAQTNSD